MYLLLLSIIYAAALLSAGHALLNKRDPRAALGWILLCLAVPGPGLVFYWLLGVNRIRTRARTWKDLGLGRSWPERRLCSWSADMLKAPPLRGTNFATLLSLSDAVNRRPLVPGNRVTPLHNGEHAFASMLEAMNAARFSVHLSTYIFDGDETGRQFAHALVEAARRGLEVRVLVDGLGELYSWPRARNLFRGTRVRYARFLPPSLSGRGLHLNLRNHRKLLIVDGKLGFCGGMNLGGRQLVERDSPRRVVDLHFRVAGPVVGEMQEAFWEDWQFATGEAPTAVHYPPAVEGGEALCRGISAGPNEDVEKLNWLLVGALNCARRRVRIMTPYFIPDRALIAALIAAALRGVQVEIMLPEKNNLPYVNWASRAYFWELLQHDIRMYYQPPPFVHSKLLLVDRNYALVGSANLDPRSLRLNFEFNLEIYDRKLNEELARHFDSVRKKSRQLSLEEMDTRPLPVKLRDAFAKLFSPYL